MQQQQYQQGALAAATECQQSVAISNLKRPQDSKVKHVLGPRRGTLTPDVHPVEANAMQGLLRGFCDPLQNLNLPTPGFPAV
jgi:hypothetical protein